MLRLLDPTQTAASLGFWLAVAGMGLALLAGASVRVVAEHQRAVVSRLGCVVRVRGPGLVFRVPGIERLSVASLLPANLPLVVSATTRDGVPVHLIASAVGRIANPARSPSAWPDPLTATSAALESALGKEVARLRLGELLPSREQLDARLPRQVTATTQGWGVVVDDLEVTDIETRLTSDLLHAMQSRTERRTEPRLPGAGAS